jgi:hypothetical protein
MTLKLDIPKDVEAGLLAQAQAEGVSLDQFVRRKLETIAHVPIQRSQSSGPTASPEAWEREVEEWFDSFSQSTVLPEKAFHRPDWYPDRW